jgi:hypothetical protein
MSRSDTTAIMPDHRRPPVPLLRAVRRVLGPDSHRRHERPPLPATVRRARPGRPAVPSGRRLSEHGPTARPARWAAPRVSAGRVWCTGFLARTPRSDVRLRRRPPGRCRPGAAISARASACCAEAGSGADEQAVAIRIGQVSGRLERVPGRLQKRQPPAQPGARGVRRPAAPTR